MFIQINPNTFVNLCHVTSFQIDPDPQDAIKTSVAFRVYTTETDASVAGTLEYYQRFLDATIKFSKTDK